MVYKVALAGPFREGSEEPEEDGWVDRKEGKGRRALRISLCICILYDLHMSGRVGEVSTKRDCAVVAASQEELVNLQTS